MRAFFAIGFLGIYLACVSDVIAKDCSRLLAQMDMNNCENENFEKADAQLNSAYQTKLSTPTLKQKHALIVEQRKWVKNRDLHCESMTSDSIGGSIHQMELAICMTKLTKKRTRELQR